MLFHEGADDTTWLLSSAVPGETARTWLERDAGHAPQVAAAMAGLLDRLHALPVDDCPFDGSVAARLPLARARVTEGLVDEDDFDHDNVGLSAAAIFARVEALSSCARGRVVTHGDFTPDNVLLDADGRATGCVDTGKLGLADPYQDYALAWRDLGEYGLCAQDAFVSALGVGTFEGQRVSLHRLLDELFYIS